MLRPQSHGEQAPTARRDEESDVAYGIVFEFTDEVGKKHYDAVNDKLGVDMAGGSGPWPKGLRSHAGRPPPARQPERAQA